MTRYITRLAMTALVLWGCSACNFSDYAFRKELGISANALNNQCPMKTPVGELTRIFVENDTLCTLVKTDTYIPQSAIIMPYALLSLSEDTLYAPLTTLLGEMADHNVWLRLRLDTKNKSHFYYASPQLLDSVCHGRFSDKETARVKVQMHVLLAQQRMPYKINNQMTMTDINYEPGLVTMAYTVAEDEQVNLSNEAFRTTAQLYVRQRIWKDLMSAKKTTTQDVIKNFCLAGCKVRYTCTGDTSGGHVEIIFTQGDLRMILSHFSIHI